MSLGIQFFFIVFRTFFINALVPVNTSRRPHTVWNFGFTVVFSTHFGWTGTIYYPLEYLDEDHLPSDVKGLYEG